MKFYLSLLYPFLCFLFILFPSFYVYVVFEDQVAFTLLVISIVSIIFFSLGNLAPYLIGLKASRVIQKSGYSKVANKNRAFVLILFFLLLYILAYLILIFDYGGLPLLKFFTEGGYPNALRADFYKEKTGVIKLAVYIRSIIGKGVLPIAFPFLYVFKRQYFYLVFFIYLGISLMSFEKSMILWSVIPMLSFMFLYKKYLKVSQLLFLLAFVVILSNIFQTSDDMSANLQSKELICSAVINSERCVTVPAYLYSIGKVYNLSSDLSHVSLTQDTNYRFYIDQLLGSNSLSFLLNRILWTPFVTAYDTILYWELNYNSEYIGFGFNRYLSALFQQEFADLERNVFRFQYGGGIYSTGNANSIFIVELYLAAGVSFVCLISFIFGLIQGAIFKYSNPIFISAFMVYPYALISASFVSMFFSGGILFFLFIYFVVRYKVKF
ncbi:hypothetical protein [Shewanella algae]|uniref:hypothetical protein n=1 Tax=Shewanella algae TaxID=38313 RepID=UPI0031F52695